jgi:hypothetical protein
MAKNKTALLRVVKNILLFTLPLILEKLRGGTTPARRRTVRSGETTLPPRRSGGTGPQERPTLPRRENPPVLAPKVRRGKSPVGELHRRRARDTIVTDAGVVVHLLPDDNDGSRHQRFLVEVDRSDVTIKISHNIDLAPRVPVSRGDRITFKGEYEYNDLGGALHWTHHDPKQWRPGGWIDHRGQRYE